jgi:SPP1 gp7 family putative phage head morphogenesis protein
VRQVQEGADLRNFRAAVADRLESAGWTPSNPSHVDTVLRTNVQRMYSEGRARQMRQPAVLAERPYWQCLGIEDDRQRETHSEVDHLVFDATDPIFETLFTPFDFNCRCRFRSLDEKRALAIGVSPGSALEVVRNPNFKCGLPPALRAKPLPKKAEEPPAEDQSADDGSDDQGDATDE